MRGIQVKKKKTPFARIEPLLYLLPAFVLLIAFVYFPFFKTVKDSFFLTDFMGNPKEFIGLENYVNILHNKKFLQSILNSLKFVVCTVPFSVGIAFILALLAGKKRKSSTLYETFFSLPMAMSMSVSAMIFQLMFNPSLGIVNSILNTDINWINDKRFAIWLLIIIQVWMNLGYNFLFLLSAIRGLPTELLECAELEGANGFQQSVKIILPLVSPRSAGEIRNAHQF